MSSRNPSRSINSSPRTHHTYRNASSHRDAGRSYDNLKNIGLGAGVLALVAGLALYPKRSGEADHGRMRDRFRRESRNRSSGAGSGSRSRSWVRGESRSRDVRGSRGWNDGGGREVERRGPRSEIDYDYEYDRRDGGRQDYVDGGRGYRETSGGMTRRGDEYDVRRGEGRYGRSMMDGRRPDVVYRGPEDRSRGMGWGGARVGEPPSRTQQWVEGGYTYLNESNYQQQGRRR